MAGEGIKLALKAGTDYQTLRAETGQDGNAAKKADSNEDGFESVTLEGERVTLRDPDEDPPFKKVGKTPKKILHFSDGTLEVYSSSEEEDEGGKAEGQGQKDKAVQKNGGPNLSSVDTKNLRWIPWVVHYTWWFGSGILGYCDQWGEKLAWILGITSPKYYYEIQDYERSKQEEEERLKRMGVEAQGWTNTPPESSTTMQPPVASSNAMPMTSLSSTLNPSKLAEEHKDVPMPTAAAVHHPSQTTTPSAAGAAESSLPSSQTAAEPNHQYVDFDPQTAHHHETF